MIVSNVISNDNLINIKLFYYHVYQFKIGVAPKWLSCGTQTVICHKLDLVFLNSALGHIVFYAQTVF